MRAFLPRSFWNSSRIVFGEAGIAKRLYYLARSPPDALELRIIHILKCAESIRRINLQYAKKYYLAIFGHGGFKQKRRNCNLLLTPGKYGQICAKKIRVLMSYVSKLDEKLMQKYIIRLNGLNKMFRAWQIRGNYWQH